MASQKNRLVRLRPGDRVDIVAPASACSRELLAKGLDRLRDWGLVPRVPSDLFGPPHVYAHDDVTRRRQLRRALRSPGSRAVWCVRGGYGSARLLPMLARMSHPPEKLFIGFSDITALQSFLVEVWGWTVLHGPVLTQLADGELSRAAREEMRSVVLGERSRAVFERLRPLNAAAAAAGAVSGRLVGGNLKTWQSLLGTPWWPRVRARILVLEDVGERGYAIDRMLVQLAQSRSLEGVRALVLGSFTGGLEPNGRFTGTRVLREFAAAVRFPVLDGLEFGHLRTTRPLPLGMTGRLALGPRPRLTIEWDPA